MYKKILFSLSLLIANTPLFASDYYVVVPLNAKAHVEPAIEVALNAVQLPAGMVTQVYPGFDFNTALNVTGDPNFASVGVTWSLYSGELPAGLVLSADGMLSGTPTSVQSSAFHVRATYKNKQGEQTYRIEVALNILKLKQVSAGDNHSCGLTQTGGVKCWGRGADGQLGNGAASDSMVPVDVVGLSSGVVSVGVGPNHVCVVTTTGTAKCWGRGAYGQLGNGAISDSMVPVDVVGLSSDIASISAGSNHTCAVTTTGTAKCWGRGASGQLGNGAISDSMVPVDVVGLSSDIASISARLHHTCAVTTTGAAKCWGSGASGRLGNGDTANSNIPVDVMGLSSGVAKISAGSDHTCAVTTAGAAKCWGSGASGQLGNGDTANSNVPVDVAGLSSGVSLINVDYTHSCAVHNGSVKCWGGGADGQLGNGDTFDSHVPVNVNGLSSGVASIDAGGYHTCAVVTGGAVKCWGRGADGQLGSGDNDRSTVPVDVRAK